MRRSRRDAIAGFKMSKPVRLVLDDKLGGFRRTTKWEDFKLVLGDALKRVTRWFRTRAVVYHLDCASGVVTVRTERWSWRRWRWEVV